MILDHINNSHLYKNIHPNLTKGFDYILNTDFSTLETGKHLIQGQEIFALFEKYKSKPIEKSNLEAHKKYVDIQYMIEGEEYIQIAPLTTQKIIEDIPNNDLTFYEGSGQKIKLKKGNFAIFFQTDAHGPGIQIDKSEEITKVVIKVQIN